MNSLERIVATINHQEVDRPPVMAQIFAHAAVVAGETLGDYVHSGETVARCQINALKRYGHDAVFAAMDVNVETEALGSVLKYQKDRYPIVERHVFSSGFPQSAAIPDPLSAGRMPEALKAVRLLREELQSEVLVVGLVLGPFTLATQLLGIENALYMAADDPQQLERVMDFAVEVAIEFGAAQIRFGAHLPIVFDPSASPVVIPPKFFREFELPRLRRLFEGLRAAGAIANWLHIAGPVGPILPYYAKAGVTIANFDYCLTPADAMLHLPDVCLSGNIKPLSFVEEGSAVINYLAVNLLDAFGRRKGFILSSGCEIPPESLPENIAAMVDAAHAKR
jgi:uroporphyrinogen decarboxylase